MSIYTVHRRLIAWGQRAAVGHVYAEGTDSQAGYQSRQAMTRSRSVPSNNVMHLSLPTPQMHPSK
jgi:hypothetical protein